MIIYLFGSVSKKKTVAVKKRMTARQKEGLVYFMEQHPQLVSGKFSSSFSYSKAQELWEECATQLNAHGPSKTALEWKKVCVIKTKPGYFADSIHTFQLLISEYVVIFLHRVGKI